jgi:hypothetical protein
LQRPTLLRRSNHTVRSARTEASAWLNEAHRPSAAPLPISQQAQARWCTMLMAFRITALLSITGPQSLL